ncbi:MAG TPA: LamG domain-containing protein [Polyangiaceae bacterium]|jgi:arabinan endo-1,5-alpha-L-arabinosidase|nr:LamG domain-containing protein [Polyangiaceae bacterium]
MIELERSLLKVAARAAKLLALAIVLGGCGSKSDLVIGNGASDSSAAICLDGQAPPVSSLVHRYSFGDTTTTVSDSVGAADGQTATVAADGTPGAPGSAAALDGSGQLTLDGTDFVALPSGLVSSLGDATFIGWTAWHGAAAYQRVFDFGTSVQGAGKRGQCESCVLLMTGSGDAAGKGLCAQVHAPSLAAAQQIVTNVFLDKTERQVAVVFKSNDSMSLYLDGAELGTTNISVGLADIVDDNDWLGLSQYALDTLYQGSYDEFRIYDRALSACEIAATVSAGPDTL